MKILKLIISVAICLAVGGGASIFTVSSISNWYQFLQKPAFNPPNWIFSPVWTTLYILMGISLFLIWSNKEKTKRRKWFLIIFILNLVLNFFWSMIFFYWQQPGWAFLEIIPLALSILILIILGWKISKPASWLLVPYFLWVSFASVLNFSIWFLNK